MICDALYQVPYICPLSMRLIRCLHPVLPPSGLSMQNKVYCPYFVFLWALKRNKMLISFYALANLSILIKKQKKRITTKPKRINKLIPSYSLLFYVLSFSSLSCFFLLYSIQTIISLFKTNGGQNKKPALLFCTGFIVIIFFQSLFVHSSTVFIQHLRFIQSGRFISFYPINHHRAHFFIRS